jgi:hypothetical protein
LGALLLALYFAAPAFTNWPFAGASPPVLLAYATANQKLFFLGAWLQSLGAVLCVMFFLILVELADGRNTFAGYATGVASALLLSVVLIEAAFMTAVPMAAANADSATVSAAFTMSNGVFVRIFPLAPAPVLFAGVGAVLWKGSVLRRAYCWTAWLLAALFVVAGLAAIFSRAGFVSEIVLSLIQEMWIVTASIAILVTPGRSLDASRS